MRPAGDDPVPCPIRAREVGISAHLVVRLNIQLNLLSGKGADSVEGNCVSGVTFEVFRVGIRDDAIAGGKARASNVLDQHFGGADTFALRDVFE